MRRGTTAEEGLALARWQRAACRPYSPFLLVILRSPRCSLGLRYVNFNLRVRTVAHTSPSLEQGQLASGHFPTSIEAGNSRLVTLQIRWLISALESQVIFFSLRRRWRLRPNLAMISHQIMHCNERTAAGAAAAATDARGTTLGPSASLSRAAAAIAANAFRTALAAARPSTSPRLLSSSPTDTLTSFPPSFVKSVSPARGGGKPAFSAPPPSPTYHAPQSRQTVAAAARATPSAARSLPSLSAAQFIDFPASL